jgi:hypothetical protein
MDMSFIPFNPNSQFENKSLEKYIRWKEKIYESCCSYISIHELHFKAKIFDRDKIDNSSERTKNNELIYA